MKHFWISFYSGNYVDEGCTEPPFKFWTTGCRSRPNDGLTEEQQKQYQEMEANPDIEEDDLDAFLDEHSRDDCTICARIVAKNEAAAWKLIAKHFPDYEQRFCDIIDPDTELSDRFR